MPSWLCDCGVLVVILWLTVAIALDILDKRRRTR